jgi:hypothetical protein
MAGYRFGVPENRFIENIFIEKGIQTSPAAQVIGVTYKTGPARCIRKNGVMNRPFNLLDYSIVYNTPKRLTDVSAWHLHIPFAFAMTAMLKPNKLVELGTHKGDSYCAFCQAVDELALNTDCFAVDNWQGDEHSGFYGTEVLEELRAYHDPLYGGFSRLMRCRFDEALAHFAERSIDLLNIDGHHSYDSVRHDFESWLPKMSHRGIVMLHDSNVREREFGVWRLWDEISGQYPSFEFKFGNGLGVLAVGGQIAEEVQAFLEYAKDHETGVSRFFYHLGEKNELDLKNAKLTEHVCQLEKTLSARDKELQQADERLRQNGAIIQEKDRRLREIQALKDRQLEEVQNLIGEKNRRLEEIYASKGWRWLTRFRKWKEMGRI